MMTNLLIRTLLKPKEQCVFTILDLVQSSYYDALCNSLDDLKREHAKCQSTR